MEAEALRVAETIAALKARISELEKLAIGGEGSTHFYWKDHAQAMEAALRRLADALREMGAGKLTPEVLDALGSFDWKAVKEGTT